MKDSTAKAPLDADTLLRGERIYLRPPRWEEMRFIQWLWNDAETMKPVGGSVELNDEGAKDWYARWIAPGRPTAYYYLIFDDSDNPVGEISFHDLDNKMTAQFNVKVAAPEQGKGYGREAMGIFMSYFFNSIGGQELVDDVGLKNEAGQQALLRFGFEHDSSVTNVFRLSMKKVRFNSLHSEPKGHDKQSRQISRGRE